MARSRQDEGARADFNKLSQKEREKQNKIMSGQKLKGSHNIPEEAFAGFRADQAALAKEQAKVKKKAKPRAASGPTPAAPRVKVEPKRAVAKESFKETITKDESKKESKPEGLSDSFKRAIAQLAPSALGMLAGATIGGEEGAVEGYDRGRQFRQDMNELDQQTAQMDVADQNAETQRMFAENQRVASQRDKSKQRLSTNWVDASNNPVLEKDGVPVDQEGNPIPTENLRRYTAPVTPLDQARINQLNASTRSRDIGAVNKDTLTPGELKADQAFASDYQKWSTGGFSNVQANISKLADVLQRIENPNTELGSVILPEFVRARINRPSVTAEQDVGNVVFQSLKEILGGQFTEKEGQKLVQQSYDPRLSDKENSAKLRATIKKLEDMAVAKQSSANYFAEKGTLKGFRGVSSNQLQSEQGRNTSADRAERIGSSIFTRGK